MKILFDQGTPVPLRRYLENHTVDTVYERGWSTLTNGDLLSAAVREGYDLLVTTDQNLAHQQRIPRDDLAILVLLSTSWPRIRQRVDHLRAIVENMKLGEYREFAM